jgi:hypothetical protein
MKQTAVEWLKDLYENQDAYDESILDEQWQKAIEMEKEQIVNAINTVSENNVKYANMIVASFSQIEGELFMHDTKLAEDYYNETFNTNEK